jgi:uncharacterized membrane protein HdeD (DUF308 family)
MVFAMLFIAGSIVNLFTAVDERGYVNSLRLVLSVMLFLIGSILIFIS